jgi:hypothetical protein
MNSICAGNPQNRPTWLAGSKAPLAQYRTLIDRDSP